MVNLDDIKNYLRVDSDNKDDDIFLLSLIRAAMAYITEKTGCQYATLSDDDKTICDVCIRLLVANWYDNRQAEVSRTGTMQRYSHTIDAIILHLSLHKEVAR